MKIIAYIASAILILFGVLFILSAFSPQGQVGNLLVGAILCIIAFVIIFFVTRKKKEELNTTNVTLNIDLPGNVSLETMTCVQCGGALTKDAISMVNGAPMVTCPYCNTTYQLTEEPKW
jgi:Na+/melibiose symporter-like transporter